MNNIINNDSRTEDFCLPQSNENNESNSKAYSALIAQWSLEDMDQLLTNNFADECNFENSFLLEDHDILQTFSDCLESWDNLFKQRESGNVHFQSACYIEPAHFDFLIIEEIKRRLSSVAKSLTIELDELVGNKVLLGEIYKYL